MDTSFQTPSPDAPISATTGQLILSAENDQFIEDLFGASSTGHRTLPDPRTSFSIGLTLASDYSGARAPLSPADPDRLRADYLVRLSTLAVSVAIDGLDNQDFSIHEFQREAVHTFQDLFPTTQDTALLPLLQKIFLRYASSVSSSLRPTPASEFSVARALLSPADPDRLRADYLVRLSTLAVFRWQLMVSTTKISLFMSFNEKQSTRSRTFSPQHRTLPFFLS